MTKSIIDFLDFKYKGIEEDKMAKKNQNTVKLTYTLAEQPKCTRGVGGTFNILARGNFTLRPGQKIHVNTGIKVDRPVHVFQSRQMVEKAVYMPDGIWAATDADLIIKFDLENKSDQFVPLDPGTVIAKFAVLDNQDIVEVE